MEIRLKRKYLHQIAEHHKGGHNQQGGKRRKKDGKKWYTTPVLPGIRTRVLLPTGKVRMQWL